MLFHSSRGIDNFTRDRSNPSIQGFCDQKQRSCEYESSNNKVECRFDPYIDNGGSCIAIAGSDFAVVVADTRLSRMYRIASRSVSKVYELTNRCILACSGMYADITALRKILMVSFACLFTVQRSDFAGKNKTF